MIKKLKIYPAIAILLVATTISATGGKKQQKTFVNMIAEEEIADNTMLDEAIQNGKLMYSADANILQAADELEKALKILDLLKSMDFSKVTTTRQISESEIKALSPSDIELLKQQSKDKKSPYNMKQAKETLKATKNYYQNMVENSKELCIMLLKAVIKGSIAQTINEPISNIKILPKRGVLFIGIKADKQYILPAFTPLYKAASELYSLQEGPNTLSSDTAEEIIKICKKALMRESPVPRHKFYY